MPSWKKVVASGSDASFSSLTVDTYVSASSFNGSFTGSLQGTASQAISSSYALTASYALISTEPIIVTSPGGIYYINGVAKPVLTFVPGQNYRFDTTAVDGHHPFKFSLTANGPTQYTYGVTSGSGFIEINVDYATSSSLFYYCTIHSGMGNQANTLRDENLIHNSQTSSMSVLSASYAYTASSATNAAQAISASYSYTASSATNAAQAISASYAYTASSATNSEQAISASYAYTASSAINSLSASYAYTASSAISAYTASSAINATTALTASSADTFLVRNDITASSALIIGTITAQTLVVQTVTSSVIYSSGSNTFGNALTDRQTFTGSVNITGSLSVNGSEAILTNQTASMSVASAVSASYAYTASSAVSASLAQTASYVISAQTASYVVNAISASYAYTASSAISAYTASSAVSASQSISSSYAYTASSAENSFQAVSSSYALTASFALNGGSGQGFPFSGSAQITGSLGVTGSFSVNGNTGQTVFASDADTLVISGSLIITGSASITGSLKVSGSITGSLFGTASQAVSSSYAYTASSAISSSYALTASYALFAANGGGGGVSAIYILDEGVVQGTASYFDFTGAGVTATVNAGTASINIPGGGGGSNTNSQNAILNQSSPAVTWSFSHNLSTLYPVFTIYDNEDNVIIPQKIHAETTASAFIYFSSARSGTAVASKGGDITSASFAATASLANFATSASYSFTASSAISSSLAQTASYVVNAISASQSATASSANTFVVRNDITASNALITGTITAQTLVVQTVTSSIVYSSGSNIFGSALTDTQTFTGSLNITGSAVNLKDGTFSGSGANLFGIPATGITGLNLSQISSGSVSASISPNFGLLINTSVSASNFTGSFTGSLAGIATSASYASFALTASYSLGGSGFPYSGSAVITGSFLVSQSFVDFSNASYFTGSLTGSLFGTASYAYTASSAISSSYATFALSASFAPGFTTNMSQSNAATTWSFTHNLNTINPIVQVYDLTNSQIIPNQIVGMNNSTAEIRFDYAQAGYAVASNGGGLYVTGSTSTLVQTVGAVTWSFTHNLNNKYNTYEVYDNNDYVLIPSAIKAIDTNSAELYFAGPQTGRAVAQFSGINGAPNATTASYAVSASFATNAASASYLNPITNSYVVLTQVSQSLNYVDDTAAAAGGVPLGGIYRNGNFILIRLS